jgi:hypothetical protein
VLRANCEDVGVHHQPNSPGFDVVLIVHVACVVVSLVTLVASAVTASRLRTVAAGGGSLPEALARYFRPGVNWAGRSLYGIPVFGFLLLALSHGAYSLSDGWVLSGLFIFVVMVLLAEGVLCPAEHRLQVSVAHWGQGPVSGPGPAPAPVGEEAVGRDARAMLLSAVVALALLVLGSVLMLVQP